jgi:hypothetical protein
MLTSIEAVGNDLLALGETFTPTLLIGKMVVRASKMIADCGFKNHSIRECRDMR